MKVMGLNPGYLLNFFLLYYCTKFLPILMSEEESSRKNPRTAIFMHLGNKNVCRLKPLPCDFLDVSEVDFSPSYVVISLHTYRRTPQFNGFRIQIFFLQDSIHFYQNITRIIIFGVFFCCWLFLKI